MTQTELARRIGGSQAYVAALESGARCNPSLEVLRRLAKALKTDVQELLA